MPPPGRVAVSYTASITFFLPAQSAIVTTVRFVDICRQYFRHRQNNRRFYVSNELHCVEGRSDEADSESAQALTSRAVASMKYAGFTGAAAVDIITSLLSAQP